MFFIEIFNFAASLTSYKLERTSCVIACLENRWRQLPLLFNHILLGTTT
jgi:hypothetical protein